MLFLLFFLELSFFFLSNVAALNITVQSDTIVGLPSLVLWEREPSDGEGLLVFDLRFVKPGGEDVGLALANIQAPPSTEFGTVQVVFPSSGSYLLVAVSGPEYTELGQSGQVNAYQVPTTSIPTSTSQAMSSSTSSAKPTSTAPTSTASGAQRKKNLGAIIGGTLGGVAFLGLLAALVIVFLRRRRPVENKRWSFHPDNMVLPPILDIRPISPMNSEFPSCEDIEHGLPHDEIPTSPIGPRPLPSPPVPLKPHQEDTVPVVVVDQIEQQIRNQMMKLEKNPGPTQHIILEDLQKQMAWLQSRSSS